MKQSYLVDRCATIIINAGGLLVIAAIISIVFIIMSVALPLFFPAKTDVVITTTPQKHDLIASQTDEYLKKLYLLHRNGDLTFGERQLQTFKVIETKSLRPNSNAAVVASESHTPFQHTITWDDGVAALVRINPTHRQTETIHRQQFESLPAYVFMRLYQQNIITVSINEQVSIRSETIATSEEQDDFFASDDDEDLQIQYHERITGISAADVSADGLQTIIGTERGEVYLLRPTHKQTKLHTRAANSRITAIRFIYGDRSFLVADQSGNVNAWQANSLTRFKELPTSAAHIISFNKGHRSKLYTAIDKQGHLQANYLTSARQLSAMHRQHMITATVAPRDDAIVTVSPNSAALWRLEAPHPEINFATLFQPVWYENYPRPEHVWQSSSASDDFEPKLGLLPLIYGTIKATFYALLLVLPLSIFAAIYVNQCASARCRAIIKPVIEILASLPSVVIGFLAAMWLAPVLQEHLLAFVISALFMPALFMIFVFCWSLLPQRLIITRIEQGQQYLLILPVICLSYFLAHVCAQPCEVYLFNGDFLIWIYETLGIQYDQRNSIVIAFALGFAVAPIIFSITEDSLATVPPPLASSSLALGASKWQTIWRVILPSASPGIFAAAIIGLGRAIGETMIVLMATGNTPIMDISPFNGMRTLAANIAVEVPEAPVNSTLYRTLYLCAALLFVLTFCFNTIAELVRTKLRSRYVNI